MINSVTFSSYLRFPFLSLIARIHLLLEDLKSDSTEGGLTDFFHEKALITSLKSCLEECIHASLTLAETEELKKLIVAIKRRGPHGSLFEQLTEKQRVFLNAIDSFSESPKNYDLDIMSPLLIPSFTEAHADFGDGKIYKIRHPQQGRYSLSFDLINHAGFKLHLYKTQEAKQCAEMRMIRHQQLKVFHIPSPDIEISGEVAIESAAPIIPLAQANLSSLPDSKIAEIAKKIHHFFVIERLWRINVMGKPDASVFGLTQDRVVSTQVDQPLVVISEDIGLRHQAFLKTFSSYDQLLKSLQSQLAARSPLEKVVEEEIQILKEFNLSPDLVRNHLEASTVLKTLLIAAQKRLGSLHCFRDYSALGTTPFDLLKDCALLMTNDHTSTIGSFELIAALQEQHRQHFLSTLLYYLCEQFHPQDTLEDQMQYVMNFAEATLNHIGKWLNGQVSETPKSFASVEEFFWARVGNEMSDLLCSLLSESSKTLFEDKLILIRYCSEYAHTNQALDEELAKCLCEKVQESEQLELHHLVLSAQLKARLQ